MNNETGLTSLKEDRARRNPGIQHFGIEAFGLYALTGESILQSPPNRERKRSPRVSKRVANRIRPSGFRSSRPAALHTVELPSPRGVFVSQERRQSFATLLCLKEFDEVTDRLVHPGTMEVCLKPTPD
jgi:hypothetical protein